jgi:hypothetical protein
VIRRAICRYLNHKLWTMPSGRVWCYNEGRYV